MKKGGAGRGIKGTRGRLIERVEKWEGGGGKN